jgi:NAD(P)-dependent dehydrogenase (short-subunit alcohol dehydrogenase family)
MMGSIGSRTGASYYSYCASKSALNMFSRLLSFDLKNMGIIVLALHPGHVKTDMGGSAAPLFPEESIRGMISVIDSITEADSGKFLDWEGGEIPW